MRKPYAKIQMDRATGAVLYVHHYLGSNLHHESGPALVHMDATTGVIVHEGYYYEARLSRRDGPTWIERLPNGQVITELYHHRSRLHRDPAKGPAVVERSKTDPSIVVEESYWFKGRPHRNPDDGPWKIIRNAETGEIENQKFLTAEEFAAKGRPHRRRERNPKKPHKGETINYTVDLKTRAVIYEAYRTTLALARGKGADFVEAIKVLKKRWNGSAPIYHREDGPSLILRDDQGKPIKEIYSRFGLLHRDPLEGPAKIYYGDPHDPDGSLARRDSYYCLGMKCQGPRGYHAISRDPVTGKVTLVEWLTLKDAQEADPNLYPDAQFHPKPPEPAISAVKPPPISAAIAVAPTTAVKVAVPPPLSAEATAQNKAPFSLCALLFGRAAREQTQPSAKTVGNRSRLRNFLRWPSLSRR